MGKFRIFIVVVAVSVFAAMLSACGHKSDMELSLTEGAQGGYQEGQSPEDAAYGADGSGGNGSDAAGDGSNSAADGSGFASGGSANTSDADPRTQNDEGKDIGNEAAVGPIFVHICGAVRNPDVYEVPCDARVIDVVKLAGGFTDEADSDYHNLAGGLADGQKIYVPTEQEVADGTVPAPELNTIYEASGSASGEEGSPDGSQESQSGQDEDDKVNINTADAEELKTLNGIGDKRANDIIDYRNDKGNFKSIEDIKKVDGIKDGIFNKIKDSIKV